VVVCKPIEPQEPRPRDGQGFAKAKLIGRIGRQVSQAGRSEVISCEDGFWLHRLLEARRLCNPRSASLLVDGRLRRAKTIGSMASARRVPMRAVPRGRLVSALAQTPRLD
jgi:hypothetical protein